MLLEHIQSHAIKTPSAIYCSGQIPCDAEGNLVEGTIQEKTAACIKNLKAVLTTAGSGIEKVVKVNIFITDMANFAVSLILWGGLVPYEGSTSHSPKENN